ncbi:4Fe-4S binding protein [Mangrovibacterium sp.]|uniref:4Fe-4S binding protein n=1 Tax=Mangrovibacterium sp. TaxID=1961364 RepID=UPI003567EA42
MKQITIIKQRCPQNHFCPVMRICPAGAISQRTPFEAPSIDQTRCTNCGKCAKYCAFGAFQAI